MQTIPPLPRVEKRYANSIRRDGSLKRECWSALTLDSLWAIHREDQPGTPWSVTYRPSAETAPCLYGTLRKALVAIATGDALRLIERAREIRTQETGA